MRTYSMVLSRVLCCLSLASLAGCFSSGAKPPGANAPCQTNDNCPSGYQCLPPTNGGAGRFCCKDKNSCGAVGLGGASGAGVDGPSSASGGTVATDGPSSKGGATDVVSGGGAGGNGIGDSGFGGTGGGITVAGGNTSGGGTAGGLSSGGGVAGGGLASGGVAGSGLASGGVASGGIIAAGGRVGGTGGGIDAAPDAPAPTPDAPVLLPLGKACTADTDCASGNCVDGVCCNKSKTLCGGCNACTNAQTGLHTIRARTRRPPTSAVTTALATAKGPAAK
jgi:hypothetical protein